MENVLKISMRIKEDLKVVPYDCVIVDNMRIIIKTKINENSDKKAVVIGINPSIACEGKSDTTLTKISKYLYQYEIGEVAMINLFETISTDQNGIDFNQECTLEKHEQLLKEADIIVVAWGTEDKYLSSKDSAFRYLLKWQDKVYCIQDKRGNKPRHSSRIAYSDELVRFYAYEDKKYPVVTLCGSTKFKEAFMKAQKKLTLAGYIVISVGLFGHSGDAEVWENMDEGTLTKTKEMLDDMHKRKIDMADSIYVINVGGYIGDSTKSEIAYAEAHGIEVKYLEPIVDEKDDGILAQKQIKLDMLTKSRRKCNACAYVQNKTDVVLYNSAEDSETDVATIGQWTMWNGNLNAEYMIVGQDWGTKKYFLDFKAQQKRSGNIPCEMNSITNKNLAACIQELNPEWDILKMDGIQRNDRYPLYFTNEILCYKDEQYMNASIPCACYRECSDLFLLKQIDIVEPKAVVLLGSDAFKNFIRAARDNGLTCELATSEKFEDIITAVLTGKENITYRTKNGKTVQIFPMWHPGGFGARNAKVAYTEKGGDKDKLAIDILKEQWKKMKVLVEE